MRRASTVGRDAIPAYGAMVRCSPGPMGPCALGHRVSALAEVEHDEQPLGRCGVEGRAHERGLGRARWRPPRPPGRCRSAGRPGSGSPRRRRSSPALTIVSPTSTASVTGMLVITSWPPGLAADLAEGPARLVEGDDHRAGVDDEPHPSGVLGDRDHRSGQRAGAVGVGDDRHAHREPVVRAGVDAHLPREVRRIAADDPDREEVHLEGLGDARAARAAPRSRAPPR